ncbi:putative vacuole fusion, non-autophagic-related protein [Papiliotrema laurentii]|uniref:Vacuole fusion, non-autophagic-related protein n=1 Tax=Papiliotrema laurentii TaxID=5418 RepID=A0AAD9FW85_PAPLA|nr:putative vacuole fusion, non-autophagic-related protein [Papiliotrema laurentii]
MSDVNESTPLHSSASSQPTSFRQHLNNFTDRFFQPFTGDALRNLPARGLGQRAKSKRADRIPDDPARPLLADYHSINDPNVLVRVPKKVLTPVKVESKVWFANERTYISYLSMGLLLSTIASGLLFGARDSLARYFALAYAVISVGILVYGWAIFQKRLTLISTRDPGSFDNLWGPLFICLALFVAILANFIFRVHQAREHIGSNPMSFSTAWTHATTSSPL